MTILKLVPITFTLMLVGCSQALDCGDKKATDLIIGITKENQLLTTSWQSRSVLEGVKASEKVMAANKKNIENESTKLQQVYSKISTNSEHCKTNLLNSESFKTKMRNLQNTEKSLSEVENVRLVEPKRFYWSANSTQKEHDEWRIAQSKYEAEVIKQRSETNRLYALRQTLKNDIKQSEEFIALGCDIPKKKYKLIAAADINDIQSDLRYRVTDDLRNDVIGYVNRYFDEPLKELANRKKILTDLEASVKRDAEKAEDEAYRAEIVKLKNAEYSLSNIVTKNVNDKTGTVVCEGDVSITIGKDFSLARRIAYRLEKTSENKLYGTITSLK